MDIQLNRESEVPLRQQLAEQIIFSIATGELRTGQQLPSVRAMARLLKIHHNTVSEVYQDLVRRTWVTRQHGSRHVVGLHENARTLKAGNGLDDIINGAIQSARDRGYSLQALRSCVYKRLLVQPPDHILVVENDAGLREIMRKEIHQVLCWPTEACSFNDLKSVPELAVGAQLTTPDYAMADLEPFVPKLRPAVSITFSAAEKYVEMVRSLRDPSIISVVSVSEILLKTARGFLAPVLGRRHVLRELHHLSGGRLDLCSTDIAFCDSLVMEVVKCRRKVRYHLVASDCLRYLASTLPSLKTISKTLSRKAVLTD